MKKIFTTILLISSINANSETKQEIMFDRMFSNASLEYQIDYDLLYSIARVTSNLNPNYLNISGTSIYFDNKNGVINAVESNNWLLNMTMGGNTMHNIVEFPKDISLYIDQYGSSRSYEVKKINKNSTKVGLMGVEIKNKDINSLIRPELNIMTGAKILKVNIKQYGLKNALLIYCGCGDGENFLNKISDNFKNRTGKELDSMFLN